MPTALFVQRDATYRLVPRVLRAPCTREQWDNPRWRKAVIDEVWKAGIDAIRSEELEFVTPAPVTLFSAAGRVICADIRLGPNKPPKYIEPNGKPMLFAPHMAQCAVFHTTYANWAEGPLFHVELMKGSNRLSPEDRRAIDSLPNQALRERAMHAVALTSRSAEAQPVPDMDDIVDLCVRGIFRIKNVGILESKQSDEGHKLLLGDGFVWDGADADEAPDNILGD